MLKRISIDYQTIPADLLPEFKGHLRILDNVEDDTILLYLAGAIDAISTYGDRDIFKTEYEYERIFDRSASPAPFWRCGRQDIFDVQVVTDQGVDNTQYYTVDKHLGYFMPTIAVGDKVAFSAGYIAGDEVPPNLRTILYRYAAHLFENREAINVGDPKHLPDWVDYALASIWVPRI